jgi:hypothetical protein
VVANNVFNGGVTFSEGATAAVNSANLTNAWLASDGELLAGSPGVDAANATYAPALDRLGRARVRAPDVGALERQP